MASYRAVTHGSVRQELDGDTVGTTYELRYHVTVEVAPAGEAFEVSITIDSVPVLTGLGFDSSRADRVRGTVFRAGLSREGKLGDFETEAAAGPLVEQLSNQLRQFFARIPPEGARPSARWSDSTESTRKASGFDLAIRAAIASEAGAWITYAGVPALEINTVSTYSVSGGGTQIGQDVVLDGTGIRRASAYLGADGRFLGLTATDTSRISATVASIGAVVPVTQARVDTVAILP